MLAYVRCLSFKDEKVICKCKMMLLSSVNTQYHLLEGEGFRENKKIGYKERRLRVSWNLKKNESLLSV